MNLTRCVLICCLALAVCGLSATACSRGSRAPEAVPAGELPDTLREAFADAGEALRDLAKTSANAFEQQQYPKANLALNRLLADRSLTKTQRETASRCLITINREMRAAAENQGDQEAAQYLKHTETVK